MSLLTNCHHKMMSTLKKSTLTGLNQFIFCTDNWHSIFLTSLRHSTAWLVTILWNSSIPLPDNFSSSLLLWPADWKFENIWHDTDMICGPLIGPYSPTEASHWPLVTITASDWPESHYPGLWLAADTWACLWESRSLQTELSLPRTLLHWALTRDRCRHQLSDNFQENFHNGPTLCNREAGQLRSPSVLYMFLFH